MSKYFSLIYSGEIQTHAESKIIPSKQFEILLDAKSVLEKAQSDAELYFEENKKACQQFLKEAQEAGFNQGLVEFNKQILCYDQKMKQFEHELQKLVLPLALKAAKKIVGKELELSPEVIVDIVRQVLKPVTQSHHIKIYVNKQDKDRLEHSKKQVKDILEQVKTFVLEERQDVLPGGCIIETEAGIINASLENQWRALESAFEAFMKH